MKNLEAHYKKLQSMKASSQSNLRSEVGRADAFSTSIKSIRQKNMNFQNSQKEVHLNRENNKLMQRLIEIQQGKLLTVPSVEKMHRYPKLSRDKSLDTKPPTVREYDITPKLKVSNSQNNIKSRKYKSINPMDVKKSLNLNKRIAER